MADWAEFARAAPDLARVIEERFAVRKHATMATLRAGGAPRISGTEVVIGDGEVSIGVMAGARKVADLRRDPRIAIHLPTVDPDDDDPGAWAGEAKLAGFARETARAEDGSHRFRIDVTEAVLTRVGTPADHLLIETWHPGRGVERIERH
jgi:hypothetical protein